MITFVVPGVPVPQPRHRHRRFGGPYIPADHDIHRYKAAVRMAYLALPPEIRGSLRGVDAYSLRISWHFGRPRKMIWKQKPMVPVVYTGTPDLDNLYKGVMDALEGMPGLFANDSAVVTCQMSKWYVGTGEPHTAISFSPFTP